MRGRRTGLMLALIVLVLGVGSPQAVAMTRRAPSAAAPTAPAPPLAPAATPPPATTPTAAPPTTVGGPTIPATAAPAGGAPTTTPPTVATTAATTATTTVARPTTSVATTIAATIPVTTVAATTSPTPTTARSRLGSLTVGAGAEEDTNLTGSPWFWLAVVATPAGLALMAAAAFGWRTSPRARRRTHRREPTVRAVTRPRPPVVAAITDEPDGPVAEPVAQEPVDDPAKLPVEEEAAPADADEPELILTAPEPPARRASVAVSTFPLTQPEAPQPSATTTRHRIGDDSVPYGQRPAHSGVASTGAAHSGVASTGAGRGGVVGSRRHWTPRRIASVTGAAVIGVLYQRKGRFGR